MYTCLQSWDWMPKYLQIWEHFVHVGVVITLRVTYIINLQFDWLTYLYAISLGA